MAHKNLQQLENHLQDTAEPAGMWQRLELALPAAHQDPGLWPRLAKRMEQSRRPPRLRADLELKGIPNNAEGGFLLSDPAEKRHFRLGKREAHILSLLDGSRHLPEIVQEYQNRFGPTTIQAVDEFLQALRQAGLLEEGRGLWGYLDWDRPDRPRILWVLPQAEERLANLHQRLRFLFHPLVGVLLGGLLLGAIILLGLHGDVLRADLNDAVSSWRWLPLLAGALYLVMIPIVLTHELAHALTCIHLGGQVPQLGLMLRHLLPAAFADVSDVWALPRGARTAVFLSGPASTALWAALATGVWAWTRPASFPHLLAAAVMLAAYYSTLVSLNPLAGYDGTEVLAEWLGRPGLHQRALTYCWGRLRGQRVPQAPTREHTLYWAYGLAVALFNVALIALLLVVLGHWLLS